MKLISSRFSSLVAVIPFVVVCAGFVAADTWLLLQIQHSSAALQETLVKISDAHTTKTEVSVLAEQWKTLNPNTEHLKNFLFQEKNLADFFDTIEALAASHGLTLTKDITPPTVPTGAQSANGALPVFIFVFNTTGDFAGSLAFLEKLEQFPTVLTVDRVNLKSQTAGGIAQMSVTVKVPQGQ